MRSGVQESPVASAEAELPIEHPPPTEAAVKELYANAIGCANPQCKAPLYRLNSDDTRTLNSRVAHICARRENGPRWDTEMSSEENRSVSNLLVMCIPHSYEVDDPQRVHLFSKKLLRSWKERQLAEYDETRNGWRLTDAEAEEVIRESYAAEVIIQGDTINLGGQGGQAPSAGGAGGTAIGRGAIGGRGGPGGPMTINLGGGPGEAPGAGGGGAAGINPESELLWRGPGRTPTVGRHEYLGMDSQGGGDTTISDAEGNVLLRAKGGQAALAGSGIRSTSDRFTVSALLLANHIEVIGAYVSLLSGGFAHYNVLNLNDQLTFVGLIVFEGGGVQEGEYAFTIQVLAPDGTIANTATPVFRVVRTGDIVRIILQFSMPAQVVTFGMWMIIALHESRVLMRLPVAIQQGITGETTAFSE
jgi:hypothetical protein